MQSACNGGDHHQMTGGTLMRCLCPSAVVKCTCGAPPTPREKFSIADHFGPGEEPGRYTSRADVFALGGMVGKAVRDIRRKTRRQNSSEEKIRIVLDGFRGEESIAALCRRKGIAEGLY